MSNLGYKSSLLSITKGFPATRTQLEARGGHLNKQLRIKSILSLLLTSGNTKNTRNYENYKY